MLDPLDYEVFNDILSGKEVEPKGVKSKCIAMAKMADIANAPQNLMFIISMCSKALRISLGSLLPFSCTCALHY